MHTRLVAGMALVTVSIWGQQVEARTIDETSADQKLPGERLGRLAYPVPKGFKKKAESKDAIPSPVPGAKPTNETYRSYEGPKGSQLVFFHWDGFPHRDRGPMQADKSWPVVIDGQKGTVTLTKMFFGTQQRVLVAHFRGPGGHVFLAYQATADPKNKAPERSPFMAMLGTFRFASK